MKVYIVTLKWGSSNTDTRLIEASSDEDADAQAERIKVNNKADEVFVEKRKNVLARLLNTAEITTKPIPVL